MMDREPPPAPGSGAPDTPFQVTLRDGRTVEISPMGGGEQAPQTRLGWTATALERRQAGYLGLAWFAPVPALEGQALGEVVVNPGLEGTALALLLLDTVVLTAATLGVSVLTVFLPHHAEDFLPVLSSAGARVVSVNGDVLVAAIPVGRGPRRFVGSGMHQATRAA